MCTSLTAPIGKLQISITVFIPKFNKFTCAKGCFLGTEYTTHGRWQFFQQLGSHDTQKHSLNDLKSSEVKFSKLLLGEILLKVHKNATDVNQCGKSRIQLPHKFSQPSQKTTSIRIFYFNCYSLIKDLYRGFCQFLRETFQDFQIAIFPFNTVFLLNIILNQLVTPQVIIGSQYNKRKMVFYMTCSDTGNARVVPTHLPFPSIEQL